MQVFDPGVDLTVYPVMGDPPSFDGVLQATFAELEPPAAITFTGAVGGTEFSEATDSPEISWKSVEPPLEAAKPNLKVDAAVKAAGTVVWIFWTPSRKTVRCRGLAVEGSTTTRTRCAEFTRVELLSAFDPSPPEAATWQ